jgi:hypothetical protein
MDMELEIIRLIQLFREWITYLLHFIMLPLLVEYNIYRIKIN